MSRRNKDGRFRKKRGNTHLSTLEKRYGETARKRGDPLETFRKSSRKSPSQMV